MDLQNVEGVNGNGSLTIAVEQSKNIMLINASIASTDKMPYVLPFGLHVLKGYVDKVFDGGYIVDIIDTQKKDFDFVIEEIKKKKPKVIGLSAKIWTLSALDEMVKRIYSMDIPDYKPLVVIGNLLSTFASEELTKLYKQDDLIFAIGEGEEALAGLIEVSAGKMNLKDVPNIRFLRNGKIVSTKRSVVNLAHLNIPSDDLMGDFLKSEGGSSIETSRGCPKNCSFCSKRPVRAGRGWSVIPIKQVLDNMEHFVQLGGKSIYLTDDNFVGNDLERARRIAEGIIARKIKIEMKISARADALYNSNDTSQERDRREEIWRLLKKAGVTHVFVGLESGSDSQLARYSKLLSAEENKRALETAKKLGIKVMQGFILFDPLMSMDEIKENIDFFEKTGCWKHITFLYQPLRAQAGSSILKELERNSLLKSFDINSLSYDYVYRDKKVARIVKLCHDFVRESEILTFFHHSIAPSASI